jgi:hypothetical protein
MKTRAKKITKDHGWVEGERERKDTGRKREDRPDCVHS